MMAEDPLLGSRRSKAALLAAHKPGKEQKRTIDIDELSGMNTEALESVLNEITGGEELPEDIPTDVPSSRQKRKCVAVREKVTKLHQMLEKTNQKAAGNAGSTRKRKATQAATAPAAAMDDDDNISSILPVSKPAHKKNRFPFSSSRSRRHRRKREGLTLVC